MCQAALQRGLQEICFTDHVDWVAWDPTREYFKPGDYIAEIEQCRARFGGPLTIRAGLEVGEPPLVAADLTALLAAWPFDFVLGSAHWTNHQEANLSRLYEHHSPEQVERDYLLCVLEVARHGDLDSLGHLDLIRRYRPLTLGPFDPLAYADIIRAILHAIVQREKAIEINTSPLRKGLTTTCPDWTILQWYRELGGQKLTLGSDAHRAEDVGAGLEIAMDMARAAGFTRLVTFKQRQPLWVNL